MDKPSCRVRLKENVTQCLGLSIFDLNLGYNNSAFFSVYRFPSGAVVKDAQRNCERPLLFCYRLPKKEHEEVWKDRNRL